MTTRKPSQRYFHALALEPRILLDAAAVTTAAEVAAQVDAPATADAPGVEATPIQSTITITDSTTSFPPVDLFKDVSVSLETGGGFNELADLVITIDRTGSNQALVIDGKSIELVAGSGTTRANDTGYVYNVSVSGTTTTITLSLNSFDPEPQNVSTLIDTMSYQALDKSVASGTVAVTLKSLSDDGGQTTDLSAIKTTVEIDSRVNVPPVISGDILKEAEALNAGVLAGSTEVAYSADGKYVYAAGSNSSISVFEVSGTGSLVLKQTLTGIQDLGTVKHMVVSADDKSVYTASNSGTLVLFNVNADGTLSRNASIAVGDTVTGSIAISDDGKQLFVGSQWNGLYVFNRDVDTGALTLLNRPEGRNGVVTTSGDYVYVTYAGAGIVTPPSLSVYQRSASGTGALTLVDSINISAAGTDLVASEDGRYLYVGNGNGITTYHLGADNRLTQANVISNIPVGSLSLNTEGSRLYAAATNGTVHIYSVADNGSLTKLSTVTSTSNGQEITVSADGQSVLISGNGLSRFSSIQTLIRGEEIALANGLTLGDANFDRLASGSGDYSGGKLLISREGGASSNDVFGFANSSSLRLENGDVLKDGQAIATFSQSGGSLTITFLAGTSRDDANAVLRQVTYSNDSSADANGSVVTLALRANDGQVDSPTVSLDVLLTNNTAPELTTTPVSNAGYDTTGTVTALFKDTTISTGEVGQSIIQLTLNIDGLNNVANEFIIVAGTRIDLSQSGSGNAGAYSYTYTRTGDSATLVITSSGINAATAQTLVNGIAYVNDTTQAITGIRTFTLASIQDNGGSGGGGDDTGEPAISASIALAINNAPQWQSDVSDPDRTLYYADGTLNGYADRVTDIVLSADGKTLVISGSTGENAAGTSYLRIYSRDTATGELTLLQTFTQGASDNPAIEAIEVNGLNAITSMAMHGNNLYLAGNTGDAAVYSLVRFTYDASTGQYSYAGIAATQGVSAVTGLDAQIAEIVISADGKSLYTINGISTIDGATGKSLLAQFSIDSQSGALTYLGAYQGGSADLGMNAPSGIVVSSDGKSVYVANRSNSMITVFIRDTQTGVLTYSGFINRTTIAADSDSGVQPSNNYLEELQDIVISPDGKYVYVGSGQQATLTVFSRDAADGSLTYVSTLSLYAHVTSLSIREIAMSSDGSALYVGFNGGPLAVLSRDSVTGAVAFVSSLNTGARSNQIAVSADGLNIYTGRSQFTSGVVILSALPNSTYVASRPSTPFSDGISFSDPDFEAANNYQGAELTISRSGTASANDLFGFQKGAVLELVDNQIMQGSTAIAEFVSVNGTLTIRFIADVDKATANQVLQQVTYHNDSAEPPARVELKLTVGDGGKSADMTLALLRATATPDPTLAANGQQASLTIGTGPLPGPVDLFQQVTVSLDDGGEPLTDLVITVDRSGADQALVIDGEEITLQGGSGQTSANGYQYVVEVNNGVTSIRVSIDSSSNAATPEATATLIDGIAYKVLADTAATGTVTITLASLSDSSDQIEPGISASVIVRDQRQLPTLGAETGSLDYADLLTQLDANGNNQLQGIQGITVIGDKVYVVRSATNYVYDEETATGSDVFYNTISVYQLGADGSLQLLESKEANGLTGAATLHASKDGSTLYLIGADGVALFNAADLQQLGTFGNDLGLVSAVVAQGDTVYVTANDKLLVFSRSGATLTLEQTLEDAGATGIQLDGANAISLSPDGKTLYVATSGGDTLVSAFSIAADGSLTFKQAVAGSNAAEFGYYASELNLSADGKTLYVIDGNSLLHVLNVAADGNLSAVATFELGESGSITAKGVIVSPDGKSVAVIGALGTSGRYNTYGIFLYSRAEDGSLTLAQKVEGFGDYANFAGTTFNEVRHAAFSADGKQLYLTGVFQGSGWNEGLLVIDLKPAAVTFTEHGEPVALLPGGTLADPQLDAADDYQGSSLVIERSGGAGDGDAFSFLNDNGLELKDDGKIWKGATAIAEFVIGANGKLTIAFLAGVSQADAQHVLRQVAYTSSSNHPTRNGGTASFNLVFNDGDGNSASLDANVGLVDINDAAVVDTTPLNPTFTTGGDPVGLFKDTQIDTIESGQKIHRVEITVSGVTAGDVINVAGSQIVLNSTVDWQAYAGEGEDRIEYRVRVSNGVATVTLYMGREAGPARDGAETAQIINSLTYSHTGSESSGTRTVSLGLVEDDYSTRSTFTEQTTVTLEGARPVSNTPLPELSATGTQTQLEIRNSGLPEAVDLFSDVIIRSGNDNQPLTALYITVNRSSADQALVIDGHEIKLQATDMAQTGANGYAYSVTINADGSATIKINLDSSNANAPADVERLVDGMSYKVLANTVADGNVVVTLTGISDYDDASLNISASVSVSHSAENNQPPIDSGISLNLGNPTFGTAYSYALPANLFIDADGDNLTWSVIGLPAGLQFDAVTRTIQGMPTEAGTFALTLKASDGNLEASRQVTMSVTEASTTPENPGNPGTPELPANGDPVLPTLFTISPRESVLTSTQDLSASNENFQIDNTDFAPQQEAAPATSRPVVLTLLHDGRTGFSNPGSLAEQLANADTVLTDTGRQHSAGSFSVEGSRLSASVDLSTGDARSITLELPSQLPDGSAPQRVTLANGLPLPSWASFDARSGELRIDRERLQRDGVLRLTLISRDGEGREQRTPMEIRAEGASPLKAVEALQQSAPVAESLPERMRQDTSSALLSDALELLDQLSDLAGEPVAVTTRHIA
ncbi:beta-propeller fold lactonase family protein [Pseudomonas sp. MM211]|uniref:beta-propeller fold lactonase family protein n=1 Tax=Pseudomonas sp. MM211 TaxID=2866808 RepID=UPI001CED1DBF|nr:beta-propeller fold lactonase family protein [Pseudomonas sp. MM211]UCJ16346.1 beta-propeller fold lactonase family protein [Pseudomonas sp. MM211]